MWKAELRYPSFSSPGDGSRAFLMAEPAAAIFPIRSTLGAPVFLGERDDSQVQVCNACFRHRYSCEGENVKRLEFSHFSWPVIELGAPM